MKKIILASLFSFAVSFVHAASLQWGGAIAVPGDKDGCITEGSLAVLLWSDSAFVSAAKTITSMEVGATSDNGGRVVSAHTINAIESEAGVLTAQWNAGDGDVNGNYAILIADIADPSNASYYDMGSIEGTKSDSALQFKVLNGEWESDEFLNMNGYTVSIGGTPGPVPEPTSGVLLILGLAGIALKRKCT